MTEIKRHLHLKWLTIRFILTIILLECASIIDAGLIPPNGKTSHMYISDKRTQTVYYCTGPKAKKFHKTAYCKGLNKCSGRIVKCSKDEARKKRIYSLQKML